MLRATAPPELTPPRAGAGRGWSPELHFTLCRPELRQICNVEVEEETPKVEEEADVWAHTSVSVGRDATGVFWAIQKYKVCKWVQEHQRRI